MPFIGLWCSSGTKELHQLGNPRTLPVVKVRASLRISNSWEIPTPPPLWLMDRASAACQNSLIVDPGFTNQHPPVLWPPPSLLYDIRPWKLSSISNEDQD